MKNYIEGTLLPRVCEPRASTQHTPHACSCGLSFSSLSSLWIHQGPHRELDKETRDSLQLLPPQAPKPFFRPRLSALFHYSKTRYECHECSRRFKSEWGLVLHLGKVHRRSAPVIPCQKCGKVFSQPHNARQHYKNMHKNENKVACVLCKRVLFNKQSLERHLSKCTERLKMLHAEIGAGPHA